MMQTQIAYVLATVDHATDHIFQPVSPRPIDSTARTLGCGNITPSISPYYGHGYVQLTWNKNYEKYGLLLGIDLVGNPSLALDP